MAQQVVIAGAMFSDVPSISVPDSNGVYHSFTDASDTTAEAGDVASGKYFYTSAGVRTAGTSSGGGGVDARWWGGIEPELIGETLWSKSPTEAANWPITPSTSNQALKWITEYSSSAIASATIDRIGKGYHGITETLDFGTYNYIWFQDAYVHFAYTVDEATMGKVHMVHQGASALHHYGSMPRTSGGQIIRPSTTQYGSYNHLPITANQSLYRSASNSQVLTNSTVYGIGSTIAVPAMSTTSSVTPDYFNVKNPSFSIRASNTYMPVDSYNYLDWSATTLNFRCRIYRVPVEYGLYTQLQDRLLDVILDEAFPTD